jgi:lipoate-protein ligase A
VDIVRRPTGGTAVLHGEDLTYCVVARAGGRGVLDAYRWIAAPLIAGLAELGIEAGIGATRATAGEFGPSKACFASTLGADLQVGGAKICGSAQLRRSGWLLQHGSMPIGNTRPLTKRLLRHPGVNRSTCMEELRPGTTAGELARALIAGFERLWGPAETGSANEFLPEIAEAVLPVQQLLA